MPLASRPGRLVVLTAGVLLAHLWFAGRALPPRLGEGAADGSPKRIEVAFVRELAPSAPPLVALPPAPRPRRVIAAPEVAASAPAAVAPLPVLEPAAPAALEAALLLPQLPPPPLPLPLPSPLALAPASAASANAAATAFEWPPSTRLTYRLTGNYRGPVEGQARVEWLRSGTRYQVFMELSIGPSFAPLMSRRVSSDGEITAAGLSPRRYDEETKVVLREPRRLVIELDADRVRLPNGRVLERPPGVQDSASQFVQMTWLFTTQPDLLQPGRSIEIPLALPRQVEPWIYDVLAAEVLDTPAGPVPAVHVKPRREPKPGGDLTAEMWVAASLQYLPVRILIRQDAETFIDLQIERLPEQAERTEQKR